jgi:hypothetical protein
MLEMISKSPSDEGKAGTIGGIWGIIQGVGKGFEKSAGRLSIEYLPD